MSEQERYLEAFKAYYTLKQEYEHKLHRMKRKIYNDPTLTDREKRAEIAKLEPKCVNCKKPGGTIFTQEGKNLKATCGNTSSPCQLNIDITRGSYIDAFNLLKGAKDNSDEKKTEIILAKLNLLFNYTNEDETAEEFEELLNDYKDSEDVVNLVQTSIDSVINNPEKLEKLDESKISIYNFITDVKSKIKAYEQNGERVLLTQAVDTTVESIMPTAENIRKLTYSINSVSYDSDDETYHLNQIPYRANDIEVDMDDPPIVSSFVVGVKKRVQKPRKLVIAPNITTLQTEQLQTDPPQVEE